MPMTAYAANGDETVTGIGFIILSVAVLIYKARKYTEAKMKDTIQTVIDVKPAIIAAVSGGAITLTATNVISLVGMCIGVAGLVIGFLQWRENKRRNDILERDYLAKVNNGDIK